MEVLCIKCGKTFILNDSEENLIFSGITFNCEKCSSGGLVKSEKEMISLFLEEKIIIYFRNKKQWTIFCKKYKKSIHWICDDICERDYDPKHPCIVYYKNVKSIYRGSYGGYLHDERKRQIIEYVW